MSFISVEYPGFEIMKSELDNYETKLILEKIIRTCYRSEPKITELSHRDMINKVLNNDHTAMLEHASITVKLFVDRAICMETIRHRLCSFAMSSTRYIDYTSGLKVVKPYHMTMDQINEAINSDSIEKNEAWLFLQSCKSSFNLYCDRIANGASKQQARGSLNHHAQAELVITTNIREWLHIFKLRSDKAAHPDFRIVSRGIQSVFHKKWPLFFRDPGFDEMPYVESNGHNSFIVKTQEDLNCNYSGNSYLVEM